LASPTGAHGWLRVAVLASIWGGAVALGLAAARLTKVGPILFEVSGRHGVHTGDVLAFAFAFTLASVCTAALLDWWAR
jgi:hypothetical protein